MLTHTAVESGFSQLWSIRGQLFFDVVYTVTLFSSAITGGLVLSFRSSSLAVAQQGIIWSSRAGLSGSGYHKLIFLYTEHSLLAAES